MYMVLFSAHAFRDSICTQSGILYIIHMFEHKYGRENYKSVCSQTQLFQLGCFNDCTRQLHVSAFTGHLQVVFNRP